jgi:hypothetical protein
VLGSTTLIVSSTTNKLFYGFRSVLDRPDGVFCVRDVVSDDVWPVVERVVALVGPHSVVNDLIRSPFSRCHCNISNLSEQLIGWGSGVH